MDFHCHEEDNLLFKISVISQICGEITRVPLKLLDNSFLLQDYFLANPPPAQSENVAIELLIVNDYYCEIIGSLKICATSGLYLIDSQHGWLLTGRCPDYKTVEEELINGDSAFEMECPNSQSTQKLWKEAVDDVRKNSRFPP